MKVLCDYYDRKWFVMLRHVYDSNRTRPDWPQHCMTRQHILGKDKKYRFVESGYVFVNNHYKFKELEKKVVQLYLKYGVPEGKIY